MWIFFFLKKKKHRGVVKKLRSGCRERLTQKPCHQGVPEGPLKGCWAERLLAGLEGEPWEELVASPAGGR